MTTKEKKRLYNQNYHREHEAELRARALEWYRQNKGSIDLGKFKDDPNLLFTAAMYIQRNS